MVKYDPNNPLSDEELDKLGKEDFDSFLEYLDSKSDYLKQFTKPLGTYHAKRFAADTAMEVSTDAVQVYGGYGYSEEYPVARLMRAAKVMQIYEGSSQVQKMIIGREITKDL